MAEDKGGTAYKILAALSAVLAALVARKTLVFVWTRATGNAPPSNPEHPDVTWQEAFGWAVLSGAVVGIARLLAQRKVARTWHKSTGALPPGLEESSA